MVLFADDTYVALVFADLRRLKDELTNCFGRIKEYADANFLKLNSDKTHFLMISSSQKKRHHPLDEEVL